MKITLIFSVKLELGQNALQNFTDIKKMFIEINKSQFNLAILYHYCTLVAYYMWFVYTFNLVPVPSVQPKKGINSL